MVPQFLSMKGGICQHPAIACCKQFSIPPSARFLKLTASLHPPLNSIPASPCCTQHDMLQQSSCFPAVKILYLVCFLTVCPCSDFCLLIVQWHSLPKMVCQERVAHLLPQPGQVSTKRIDLIKFIFGDSTFPDAI